MNTIQLQQEFRKIYGKSPEYLYFAPGRVNLIGEHIDYNGGLVFPCAITFGTWLLAARRNDCRSGFASLNFPETSLCDPAVFELRPDSWEKYPLGVMKEFAAGGFDPWGYDILYWGDVPNGAGLSSSAAIEVVTALFLNDRLEAGWDKTALALLAQRAENGYVGMNSGIMDQFAVAMGKKDHAIALDCRTLAYEYAPLKMEGYSLVIANTNKQRKLTDSKYNERRAECEEGLRQLNRELDLAYLCQLTGPEWEKVSHLIDNEVIRRRVHHVVTENDRVKEAVSALNAGNLVRFGELMNASHRSLQTDYEVTGIELDTLAGEAQKMEGVLGSRMTGAGFGGCTVTLIRTEAINLFREKLGAVYHDRTGLTADFYVASVGDGAQQVNY